MLNQEAGAEDGKIWKFSQSKLRHQVEEKVEELKKIPPFSEDKDLQDDIDTLSGYTTKLWVINDSIEDHNLRRELREKNHDLWQYLKKYSKLRRNYMTFMPYAIHSINTSVGDKAIDTPIKYLGIRAAQYDAMPFAQKLEFVEQIDQEILDYLTALHTKFTQ